MPCGRLGPTLALAGALLAGCGSGRGNVALSGAASYQGQPIEQGSIELHPTDGTGGPATGAVIRDGQWKIDAEGGPLGGGTYVVRITGLKKTGQQVVERDRPNQPADVLTNFIPPRYNVNSTLKITIPPGGSDEISFDLPR